MSRKENESPRSAQYAVGLRLLPDGDFAFTGRSSVVVKNETRVMPGSQGFSSFASPSREPHRNSREADGAHDENHSSDDHSGRGADHVGYLDGRGSSVCVSVRRGLVSRRVALPAASADDARGHLCRTLPMRNSGSGSVSSILSRSESSSQARYPEENSTPQAHPDMLTGGSRMSMRFWYAFVRTLLHELRAWLDCVSHAILRSAASLGARDASRGSTVTSML